MAKSKSLVLKKSRRRSRSPLKRSKRKTLKRTPKRSKRRSPSLKRKSRKRHSTSSKKSKSKSNYGWMDTSKFKKNSLGKYGYNTHIGMSERHAALKRAIKAYGEHSVWSKLNAVSILNKNRSPKTASVFTSDKNWVKREYITRG